jgi:patatin-like phospholipase/acyl hydrolase
MRTIRILELDGGGIRGIFSNKFMELFCQQAGISDVYSSFDIIVGTSIGGIAALGYANGLTPTQVLNLLVTNGPLIFPASSFPFNTGPASPSAIAAYVTSYGYVYNNDPLLTTAADVLGTTKMFQLKTNVLISSVLIQNDIFSGYKNHIPQLFSNVLTPYTQGQDYSAVDVAMATSAAPAYFPAWSIPGVDNPLYPDITNLFVDGGLYQNNATALAYAMSQILYPGKNKVCILSVGTGYDKGDQFIETPDTLTFYDFHPEKQAELLQKWMNKGYGEEQIEILKNEITNDTIGALPYLLANSLSITLSSAQSAVNTQFEIQSLYAGAANNLYYYRFQTLLSNKQDNALDNATAEYMTYLQQAAIDQYTSDQLKISAFIQNAGF